MPSTSSPRCRQMWRSHPLSGMWAWMPTVVKQSWMSSCSRSPTQHKWTGCCQACRPLGRKVRQWLLPKITSRCITNADGCRRGVCGTGNMITMPGPQTPRRCGMQTADIARYPAGDEVWVIPGCNNDRQTSDPRISQSAPPTQRPDNAGSEASCSIASLQSPAIPATTAVSSVVSTPLLLASESGLATICAH